MEKRPKITNLTQGHKRSKETTKICSRWRFAKLAKEVGVYCVGPASDLSREDAHAFYEHLGYKMTSYWMRKKNMDIKIEPIRECDYYEIECLTKRAFWNLNMPGCDEHYLVHRIVNDSNYVPSLSLVAKADGSFIGTILYTKCRLETTKGDIDVLTFGPLCVDPEYQGKGVGKALLLESIQLAKRTTNYPAIFICGVPTYYPKFGFKPAAEFGVTMPDGSTFDAFMGYELKEGFLKDISGKFYEPDCCDCDIHDERYVAELEEFDRQFPYMEKKVLPGQWR